MPVLFGIFSKLHTLYLGIVCVYLLTKEDSRTNSVGIGRDNFINDKNLVIVFSRESRIKWLCTVQTN